MAKKKQRATFEKKRREQQKKMKRLEKIERKRQRALDPPADTSEDDVSEGEDQQD